MITQNKIEKAANKAGWYCLIEKESKQWHLVFRTDTHHGKDVIYEYDVKRLEDIKKEVSETYEGFDVNYETSLCLDKFGNPTKGAPKKIRDLVNDIEEEEEKLEMLSEALEEIDNPKKRIVTTTKEKELLYSIYDMMFQKLKTLETYEFIDKFRNTSVITDNLTIRLNDKYSLKLLKKEAKAETLRIVLANVDTYTRDVVTGMNGKTFKKWNEFTEEMKKYMTKEKTQEEENVCDTFSLKTLDEYLRDMNDEIYPMDEFSFKVHIEDTENI